MLPSRRQAKAFSHLSIQSTQTFLRLCFCIFLFSASASVAFGQSKPETHLITWIGDSEFDGSLKNFTQFARQNGRIESNKYVWGANLESFQQSVAESARDSERRPVELFINVVSHGQPGQLETSYIQPANGAKYRGPSVSYRDIAKILVEASRQHPNLTINFNLLSCYSGSFIPILQKLIEETRPPKEWLEALRSKPKEPIINVTTATDAKSSASAYWGTVLFDSDAGVSMEQKRKIAERFPGLFENLSPYDFFLKVLSIGPRLQGVADHKGAETDRTMVWSTLNFKLH